MNRTRLLAIAGLFAATVAQRPGAGHDGAGQQRLRASPDRGGRQHPPRRRTDRRLGRAGAGDDARRGGRGRLRAPRPLRRDTPGGRLLHLRRSGESLQAQYLVARLLLLTGGRPAAGGGGLPRRHPHERAGGLPDQFRSAAHGPYPADRGPVGQRIPPGPERARRRDQPGDRPRRRPAAGRIRGIGWELRRVPGRGQRVRPDRRGLRLVCRRQLQSGGRLARR